MTILVFCSYEVGGQPFRMAGELSRQGLDVRYVSLTAGRGNHDSTRFHYGEKTEFWDRSASFRGQGRDDVREKLRRLGEEEGITGCLAMGEQAWLLREAGLPYHYWSYGSDLDKNCFLPGPLQGVPVWTRLKILYDFFRNWRRQARRSIRRAEAVMISPYQKTALSRVAPDKPLFFLPHLLEAADYGELQQQRSQARERVCRSLGADHVFFSSTRHVWTKKWETWSDHKGNDVALRAFAAYAGARGPADAKLVLVRKGPDAEASRTLARELGVERSVVWVEEMKRDDVTEYYRAATACLGQFGTPVATYAALEPLAQGGVCASFFAPAAGVPYYRDLPPLLNSRDPGEIASFMKVMAAGGAEAERQRRVSWEWVRRNCSPRLFARTVAACLGEEIPRNAVAAAAGQEPGP